MPRFYPTANGKAAPTTDSDERNAPVVLAFLAAYYEINLRWADLQEVRQQELSDSRERREKEALRAIETALRRRDALEDQYAPTGLIAEPVMENSLAVDVKFTFGNTTALGKLRSEVIVFSADLSIPLPPGISLGDLTVPDQSSGADLPVR